MTEPPEHPRWKPYGHQPLPSPEEALNQAFAAFLSRFLRLECDRRGKERLLNEAYISEVQRRTRLGVFLSRARHEGWPRTPTSP